MCFGTASSLPLQWSDSSHERVWLSESREVFDPVDEDVPTRRHQVRHVGHVISGTLGGCSQQQHTEWTISEQPCGMRVKTYNPPTTYFCGPTILVVKSCVEHDVVDHIISPMDFKHPRIYIFWTCTS
jgi:hypothetical protein